MKCVSKVWTGPRVSFISLPEELFSDLLLGKAQVAQSVEQVTENHRVGGSIPSLGTILIIFSCWFLFF